MRLVEMPAAGGTSWALPGGSRRRRRRRGGRGLGRGRRLGFRPDSPAGTRSERTLTQNEISQLDGIVTDTFTIEEIILQKYFFLKKYFFQKYFFQKYFF
jgi:hypothetical protein